MALTTNTLLPLTNYGVPSGNYNGTTPDFIGNTVSAASYYTVKSGSVQTAVITTTNFVGKITLQASLGTVAEQTVWFDVESYDSTSAPTTGTTPINLIGNFVWVRASVTNFVSGTINSATLLY